jgi:hypothetical protein
MFHIAIAIVAIAVVAKRKEFWYVSMIGGAVGVYFFAAAFIHAPAAEPGEAAATEHAASEHASTGTHAPTEHPTPATKSGAPAPAAETEHH